MIPQLVDRGFSYGSGTLSPDLSQFIVNIPKNASSYMLDWARRHQWMTAVADDHSDTITEMIVILRDPLDRWVSGIVQYLNTYILSPQGPNGPVFPDEPYSPHNWPMDAVQWIDGYNQTTERLIFDVVNRFDDHVWSQHEFVEDLLPAVKRKYFLLDRNFDAAIADYLGFAPYSDLDSNSAGNNANMRLLQKFFVDRLQQRPDLAQRVIKAYAKDYELIARTKQ
jgi:hypothetical protein